MRKLFFTMIALVAMATSAFAQTEKGKIYVGASSNLDFKNVKYDGADKGTNFFTLDANGGYFIMDNLSINAKVGFGLTSYDGASDTQFSLGAGARYYFPPKVFLGALFDFNSVKYDGADEAVTDPGIALQVGYALFLNDVISIEPSIGYRLGLGDKEKGAKYNAFGINIGFGIYF